MLAIFGLKNEDFFFYFRFLATKLTVKTALKTVLNRCFWMWSMSLPVDIKKAIQLVSGAAGVFGSVLSPGHFSFPSYI